MSVKLAFSVWGMLTVLFLCWEVFTTRLIALLTLSVFIFHMKKKKSQGQVNVPECFKNPTKSICYIELFYRYNI